MTDYEARLRGSLVDAERRNQKAVDQLEASDAHPNSQDHKSVQWLALIASGEVIGLTKALSLLTGEEHTPNVTVVKTKATP
jgi:hypothetical protein